MTMHIIRAMGLLTGALLVACGAPDAPAKAGTTSAPASAVPYTTTKAVERPRAADGVPRNAPRRVVVGGLDLTGVGHDRGSPTAPLVVINFSDFGCPYCAKYARETEPAIDEEYIKTGKVFLKYVPFVMGMFPNGAEAARAAECAGEQGRFRAMHDRLYERQHEWKGSGAPDALLAGYAAALQLDRSAFAACYARAAEHPRTARANQAAQALGVRATPSFLVGDRPIEGAPPLAQFRALIEETLGARR